jgi:glycosyltransferase involved in cell wall biosynthesis
MKVLHLITRLILGGAQENTLLTVEDQQSLHADTVWLVTGPALGPEGSLVERARRRGVNLHVLPALRREIHPARDLAAYLQIVNALRAFRPELVHTHSSKAGILGRAAAWKLGIPAVHTIHGAPFHAYQSRFAWRLYRGLERWAARRCRKLISVCDAMTDQFVAAGVAPRDKFVTVYSGMEVEPFLNPPLPRDQVRAQLGVAPGQVLVGKIARLFELKGHDDVVDAARTACQIEPRLKFLFVGDGILQAALKRRIADAGLEDRFILTGLVPPERVPELVGAMDILVHASLREGLARALVQALVAGKPVISYDIDGAREVVINDQTGILLPPRSITGLSDAMVRLAADAALRDRFGQTGRQRFTDRFRHQTMTARLREIYQEVLAEPQGS